MANWDFIVAYDSRATDWLSENKLPHPAVRPGNRLPSTAEIRRAWRMHDPLGILRVDDFNWNDDQFVPEDCFRMCGDWDIELKVLAEVGKKCGQLWMYPDTGAPAIVVDSFLDIDKTLRLYKQVYAAEDGWSRLYAGLYS
jgi:hypothetical protein